MIIIQVIISNKFSENVTVALEASLLGHLFIFRTIFQPWALSSDIPVGERGLFTKYRDLSVSCRSIIYLGPRLWQIIDLLATVKSWYFAQRHSIIVNYHHCSCSQEIAYSIDLTWWSGINALSLYCAWATEKLILGLMTRFLFPTRWKLLEILFPDWFHGLFLFCCCFFFARKYTSCQ